MIWNRREWVWEWRRKVKKRAIVVLRMYGGMKWLTGNSEKRKIIKVFVRHVVN